MIVVGEIKRRRSFGGGGNTPNITVRYHVGLSLNVYRNKGGEYIAALLLLRSIKSPEKQG